MLSYLLIDLDERFRHTVRSHHTLLSESKCEEEENQSLKQTV